MTQLLYITRSLLPSNNAKSHQISEMCTALSSFSSVTLLSRGVSTKDSSNLAYSHVGLSIPDGKFIQIRFLFAILRYLPKIQTFDYLYSRDIFIALLFSLLGFKVAYEAHNKPLSVFSRLLHFIAVKFTPLKYVFISYALLVGI